VSLKSFIAIFYTPEWEYYNVLQCEQSRYSSRKLAERFPAREFPDFLIGPKRGVQNMCKGLFVVIKYHSIAYYLITQIGLITFLMQLDRVR
jgi:hypothetical protein